MSGLETQPPAGATYGVTLIELVIVVAVVGVLLTLAIPNYQSHLLRVHRTQAVRLLLEASMCQERLLALDGKYDTTQCRAATTQHRYQIAYLSADQQDNSYVATATPKGAQLADPCGTLSLDQSGVRGIGAKNVSVARCWSGR